MGSNQHMYQSSKPSAAGREFVESFWEITIDDHAVVSYLSLPDPYINLFIGLADGNTVVKGIQLAENMHNISGPTFGIRLFPAGFQMLFQNDIRMLNNKSHALADISSAAHNLFHDIKTAPSFKDRKDIFESYITGINTENEKHGLLLAHKACLIFFEENTSEGRIEDICKQVNVTYKTLERHFKRYLGITPKHFQRLVRLKKVTDNMYAGRKDFNQGSFTDPSHLNKEFKKISTKSPGAFYKEEIQALLKMSKTYNS